MKALLDTHTFIWLDNDPGKLSETVAALCSDKENVLFLSIASIWEIQIKLKLGKLTLPLALDKTIAEQQKMNGLHLLPIELRHVLALDSLPDHHKDPFDRLLIAQAKAEGLTFITNDPVIAKYPVTMAW